MLGTRWGYSLFRTLIRADRGMQRIVQDYIRPQSGQTIADLGCGTGDLADMLPPDVVYIGVDHNDAYLDPSQAMKGATQGRRFINGDLGKLADLELPPLDAALALGVLHHLDDDQVRHMLTAIRSKLAPGGRMVTVDPVLVPAQRSSARIMMVMDRGRHVRQLDHYRMLVGEVFPDYEVHVRGDLNPFPYTHCIFEATSVDAPATASASS